MPTTADHVPLDTLEEGQIISPHQQTKPSPQIPLHERISHIAAPTSGMDTQTTNNVTAANHALAQQLPPPPQQQLQQLQQQQQPGIPSSSADFQTDRLGMHAVNTSAYPANISLLLGSDKTIGESTQSTLPATEAPTTTAATTTDTPTRNGPAAPYPLPDEAEKSAGGYERKIGRGTSWRRDHDTLNEQDYTVRGRGRGRAGGHPQHHHSSTRGRGRRDENYDSRDYNNNSYRRDPYDRRPPPPTPPPPPPPPSHAHVASAFPPSPDPYYESPRVGAYPSPAYDARRDYPPPSFHPSDAPPPARYYEDYRRGGYDARDIPPPPLPPNSSHLPTPPTVDSRRPYDRGVVPGRDDPADYGRGYPPRSRDPRDDYPPMPRDVHPRLPPSDRLPPKDAGRYIDEGTY